MLEFNGFFNVILKFTFELLCDIFFAGKSNVIPLNVFVLDAENVVLPVIYTLLPSLAVITIFNFIGANDAGLRALLSVIVFELLVDDEYSDENINN